MSGDELKKTEAFECPFCGTGPLEGEPGHTEWDVEGDSAFREFICPCGAHLIIHYNVSLSYVEGESGHAEWNVEGSSAFREFSCSCEDPVIAHYDVAFSYVEGLKETE